MAADERQGKITPELGLQLQEKGDGLHDVIVELAPDPAESGSAPEMRQSFEKAIEPISATIARSGGEVTDAAWLNRTLRAKLPAEGVRELMDLQEVAALDVPHRITRD